MSQRTRPSRTTERRPASDGLPDLELVRSARRRRTASAHGVDGRVVVQLPAGLPVAEEDRLIRSLVRRVTGRQRADAVAGDHTLQARADELADRWLDGVRATSVRWSDRMQKRWGSCTPHDGSIRISRRLAAYPRYVLDAVLVHELAHLQVADHSRTFHDLVGRFPGSERARGFLDGIRFAAASPDDPDELPDVALD